MDHQHAQSEQDDAPDMLGVGDPLLGKTRLLSRQCDTGVFRPGNLMSLGKGRLRALIADALARQRYIICHETLPYASPPPGVRPAICRGFHDRYDTAALQIIGRLWGFMEVPAPQHGTAGPAAGPPSPPSRLDTPAVTVGRSAVAGTGPSGDAAPLVFVDVDGVLNPDVDLAGEASIAAAGYIAPAFDGTSADGGPASGTVWLHPHHGAWLRELATHGAVLAWATSWNHLAPQWIASRLGLPSDWPTLHVTSTGVAFGHAVKLGPITRFAGHRPLAVIDEEFGGKDRYWARTRTREGTPTHLVQVNPAAGLRRTDIDAVLAWLDDIATGRPDAS